MKQYKLLKDLPGINAGEIGVYKNEYYHFKRKRKGFLDDQIVYDEEYIKQYPDFFEEVLPMEKLFTIEDMEKAFKHDSPYTFIEFVQYCYPQHIDQLKYLK